MSSPWLILDVSYLAWRAFHTTGRLAYGETPTGVVYGLLRDIQHFPERFDTDKIAFAFDSKHSRRKEVYPQYKANRKKADYTEEEQLAFKMFISQVIKLRKEYLPVIGYQNVFQQKGYEADDVIASLCKHSIGRDHAIIISADEDLYQLITPRVSILNPTKNKTTTLQTFKAEYGITPDEWAMVKAIAGCSSDNVKGVQGVGLKTALKHIRNELPCKSMAYKKIMEAVGPIHDNLALVELPLIGCKRFKLREDNVTQKGWEKVTRSLGMESLAPRKVRGVKWRNGKRQQRFA